MKNGKTPPTSAKLPVTRFFHSRLMNRYYRRRKYLSNRRAYYSRVEALERTCERLGDHSSVPYLCEELATISRNSPKEFRGVNGEVLAELYLKAIEENAITEAILIAKIVKQRPPKLYSKVQNRRFEVYVGRNIAVRAPDGVVARVALETLQGMGYRVPPDIRLATALLTENRTPAYEPLTGDRALEDTARNTNHDSFRSEARKEKEEKRNRMIAAGRKPPQNGMFAPAAGR